MGLGRYLEHGCHAHGNRQQLRQALQ